MKIRLKGEEICLYSKYKDINNKYVFYGPVAVKVQDIFKICLYVCTQNTKILIKQTCFYGPVSVKYQYIIKITAIPGVLEAGSSGHAQPAYCHSH